MKYQDAEKRCQIGEHQRNDRRLPPVCFENAAGKCHDLRPSALVISATSQSASGLLAMPLARAKPPGLLMLNFSGGLLVGLLELFPAGGKTAFGIPGDEFEVLKRVVAIRHADFGF